MVFRFPLHRQIESVTKATTMRTRSAATAGFVVHMKYAATQKFYFTSSPVLLFWHCCCVWDYGAWGPFVLSPFVCFVNAFCLTMAKMNHFLHFLLHFIAVAQLFEPFRIGICFLSQHFPAESTDAWTDRWTKCKEKYMHRIVTKTKASYSIYNSGTHSNPSHT